MDKEDKIISIISFSILGLFLIYGIIGLTITKKRWSNVNLNKKYTIGTITSFEPGAKTPPSFIYKYNIKRKDYKGDYGITDQMRSDDYELLRKLIGHRFYVKYIEDYPNYSRLLIYRPVPDSIKEAPKDGWEKLPTNQRVRYE